MIWLPILAIIVFFIILISSIIIGYRIGWRASFFISALFFIITFISIIICLLIYKKTLWPFYQKLFLNKLFDKSVTFSSTNSGKYTVDPSIFEGQYKSRAILVFSLMFTPVTFIIVFFSYFLLRKKINNYMRPKVTQTEINVKAINSKPKVFRSRMMGMGILGLSFVFASSYIASGIAAASEKKDKRSFFNNITDSLAAAYSLSFAENESESRNIDEVISYIDKDFFDNTRDIWTTIDFKNWDLARAEKIKDYLEKSELIKKINSFEDKDDREKLFETVFASSLEYDDKHQEKVLEYSQSISRGPTSVPHQTYTNQLFKQGLGLSGNTTAENIIATFATFPRIKNLIPESTVKKIIEKFKQNFEEFDKSFAALQLSQWEKNYSDAQQLKSKRQQNLANLESEISTIQNEANFAASKIQNYTGVGSSLTNVANFELREVSSLASAVQSQTYLTYSKSGQMQILSLEIKALDNSISIEERKKLGLERKVSNALAESNTASSAVQRAQSAFNTADARFKDNTLKITNASEAFSKFKSIETEINRLNQEKVTLSSQSPPPADKAAKLQALSNKISEQENLRRQAKTKYSPYRNSNEAELAKTQAQNQRSSLQGALGGAQKALSSALSNQSQKQAALTAARKDLSDQQAIIDGLKTQKARQIQSFDDMKEYIKNYFGPQNLQSKIQTWKASITSKSSLISKLKQSSSPSSWSFVSSNDNGSIAWAENKIKAVFTLKLHAQKINDDVKKEYEETLDKLSKALSSFLGH